MNPVEIKENFLTSLKQRMSKSGDPDLVDKMPPIYDAMIDEAIDGFTNGSSTWNGGIPNTETEWFVAIGQYFLAASATLQGVIKGAINAFPDEDVVVNINYRGKQYNNAQKHLLGAGSTETINNL